jgi:hypothetical protein
MEVFPGSELCARGGERRVLREQRRYFKGIESAVIGTVFCHAWIHMKLRMQGAVRGFGIRSEQLAITRCKVVAFTRHYHPGTACDPIIFQPRYTTLSVHGALRDKDQYLC